MLGAGAGAQTLEPHARTSALKHASPRPRVHPRGQFLVVLTRPVVFGDSRALPVRAAGLLLCGNQGTLVAREQMSAVEHLRQFLGDTGYWAKQGITIIVLLARLCARGKFSR